MAISLRGDFEAARLRGLAKKTKDGPQARRLLALAAIYDGATRTEAAKIGGVGLQIIRDWVLRFNARGPAGLLNGKSPGQPSKLNDTQRQAVARMIESGPIPAVHGVVRWRLIDLAQWIFGIPPAAAALSVRLSDVKQYLWTAISTVLSGLRSLRPVDGGAGPMMRSFGSSLKACRRRERYPRQRDAMAYRAHCW
jgi:transposase